MVAAVFASTNDGAAHVVGWGLLEILSLEPGYTDKSQPTKLAARWGLMGIGFPKLGFRFGELAAPGHLGVAHSELKLSKPEAFGCGGLVLGAGASHYLSSTTPRIIDMQASWSGFWSLEQVRPVPDACSISTELGFGARC